MQAPTSAGYAGIEPTKQPPWHNLVVWDVFLNALTTGLFLTAAVAELVRPGEFASAARWAFPLALLLLLTDLTCLVLDLGDPLRFHHMLRVFKPSSPMSLGTWCLTAYSLPLTLVAAMEVLVGVGWLAEGSRVLAMVRAVMLAVGLPFAFGSMGYKGVLFSTSSQPGWRDARWFGAYHCASALALGAAVLLLLSIGLDDARAIHVLRPALIGLVILQACVTISLYLELQRVHSSTAHPSSHRERWLVVAANVVPLVMLFAPNHYVMASAAIWVLAIGWVMRHWVVMLPHHHAGGK